MCNLSRNAELSALEAHHAVQSRCWQDDSLLMCFVPVSTCQCEFDPSSCNNQTCCLPSLAVIARINCPDHKIRESQAAINATPLQAAQMKSCWAVIKQSQADKAAHPVGASLLFRLSSVKAVAYKLHRSCMVSTQYSKVTQFTATVWLTFHRRVQYQLLLVSLQAMASCTT